MSYVVTGFYTPNYAEIADAFRRNLSALSIPHKLYAAEMLGESWAVQTFRKPHFALRALDEHPDKTVIIMDVDCIVRGDLAPLLDLECDVALYPAVRKKTKQPTTSTRVVVIHQTPGARRLITAWQTKCDEAISTLLSRGIRTWHRDVGIGATDESLMRQAIDDNPDVIVAHLRGAHSGNSGRSDALVGHQSAHDRVLLRDRIKVRIKKTRRALVQRVLGVPYMEWRYGIRED